ncbi:GH92 family glycosyl hydrolase [Muricauda oceani]|uniref:Glycoside hydrolase family 92 protein n=1 Tax=Flagellimonas oceani TaxID=2698672 RepID=A0A6G7J4H7_9FLAO|nr:GH92 family glycosyl hydrolase [Allomuricauda oceani]MBW8242677.1 GH92 family glycosyl hydrolase [Allomuricauda oceani]QII45580.1 glycoside hydrolase family 92 protein [Allomuricauda oceani]
MTTKQTILFLSASILLSSCKTDGTKLKTESLNDKTPYAYVNTFMGTAPLLDEKIIGYTPPKDWRVWAGLTFPGSSLPNAMVQVSPITEYGTGAGYEYEDTEILGFAHTNKGHWNLCNLPVLPISAQAKAPFKATFSHDNESASPGFYQVHLQNYDINVRLTSTLRAAIHEYQYEEPAGKRIVFDLGTANNHVSDWGITKVSSNELSGHQKVGRDKIHFYARMDAEIDSIVSTNPGESKGYAIAHLKDDGEGKVTMKIGLSYVNEENAKLNLEQEVGAKSFEDVFGEGKKIWSDFLNQIEVTGGSEKQKEIFYTSLYKSFLWPALRSDSNGDFVDAAGKVQNRDFHYYTIPSLWDTYRNKVVLMEILRPEVTSDVISSLIDRGAVTGFIPTFFHGDHAASFITGSYLRGIKDFDVEKAYELLLNNAYKEGGTRPYIKEYMELGYISEPRIDNPNTESKGKAGVSKTLEFAYDDYSLSLLAEEMDDPEHQKDLLARSKNYKNVFDRKTNFMRGRLANGDWVEPFNPEYPYYEYMYREANAWQVSFFATHDMPGLIDQYGGEEKFEEKLDSLFTYKWNPDYIARNISGFMGQYSQGNQPGHEAPFSYYFIGKPEKSQAVIDKLLSDYYGIGEEGLALSGMDDAGEMSSWYVFNALGLYPFSPSDPEYLVTVPIFDTITWNLKDNKTLKLIKDGESRDLKDIYVNGARTNGFFIDHSLFDKGGEVLIKTEN